MAAAGTAIELDGEFGVYVTGTQKPLGQAAKLLLARLDTQTPANDWAVVYSTPGGGSVGHGGSALAMGRDGNNNTMVAVSGWMEQESGPHTDMLTVLFSGTGKGTLSPRCFARGSHSGAVDGNDWATGVLLQPDVFDPLEWRVYTTGVVTNGSGNRDWRTLMYKSINVDGSQYPPPFIRRDFVGPSGNDEPAALIFQNPGVDRKFFVVGYSNQTTTAVTTGDDIYLHKYEDITP